MQSVGLLKRVLAVFNLLDGCVLALDDPPPDAGASIYSVAFRPNADIGAAERGAPLFTSKTGTSICTMQPPEPSMCSSVDDTHSTFYYSMPAKTVYCVTFNTKALEVVCKNNMDMLLALAEMGHLHLKEAQDAAVDMAQKYMNLSHCRRKETIVLKAAMNTIIMAQEESERRDHAAAEAAEQAEDAAVAARDEAARVLAAQVVERVTAADVAEAVAAQECINARKAAGIWEEEEPAVTPPGGVNAVPAANPEAAAAAAAAATLHEQAVAAAGFEKAKPMAAVKAAAVAKQHRQAAAASAAAAAAKLEEQTAAAAAAALHEEEEEEAAAGVEAAGEVQEEAAAVEEEAAATGVVQEEAAAEVEDDGAVDEAAATATHESKVANMKATYKAEARARAAAAGELQDAAEAEAAAAALKVQEDTAAALKVQGDADDALKAEQDAEAALKAEQDAEAALEAEQDAAAALEAEQEEEANATVENQDESGAVTVDGAVAGAEAEQAEIGAYRKAQTLWNSHTLDVSAAALKKYQDEIKIGEVTQALRAALEDENGMEPGQSEVELSFLVERGNPTLFEHMRMQERALGELRERREQQVQDELRHAGYMENGTSLHYGELYSSLVPVGLDKSLEDANNKLKHAQNKIDELESTEEDHVEQGDDLPPPPPYRNPTVEIEPPVRKDDRPVVQEEDKEDEDEAGTSTATPLMQYLRGEYQRGLARVTSLEDQKAGVDFLTETWAKSGQAGAAAKA